MASLCLTLGTATTYAQIKYISMQPDYETQQASNNKIFAEQANNFFATFQKASDFFDKEREQILISLTQGKDKEDCLKQANLACKTLYKARMDLVVGIFVALCNNQSDQISSQFDELQALYNETIASHNVLIQETLNAINSFHESWVNNRA